MDPTRQLFFFFFFFFVASMVAPLVWARPSPPTQEASGAAPAPDLSIQRTLIEESNTARNAGDYDTARALALEVVTHLLARPAAEQDAAWLALLNDAGSAAYYAQDSSTANAAWKRVHEVRLAALPSDHPDLQATRHNLAATLHTLGDLTGARALEEQALEVFSRTLPDDHRDLQAARLSLALTIKALRDLAGARALEEQVLEVLSRTLPADHPDLQAVRLNLATSITALGDFAGARALQEQVLEVFSRTLPADHPDLQAARLNLAVTIQAMGDLAGARALEEQVLEVFSRTLPDEHPALQKARGILALTIKALGDLAGARALQEQVLEVFSRTLPADHPDLRVARHNLAGTIAALGDLAGARALEEQVLEVCSRTLPADHPELQTARGNLAVTLYTLGDLVGARALQEQVLEVFSRSLPDDHPALQTARGNLAATLHTLGDLAGARALQEQVLELRSRTLPADHPDLQAARHNLASTLYALGDLAGARALQEQALEVRSRTLRDDHPDLQTSRLNLAATIKALGDLVGARALQEQVLDAYSRTLPADHPARQVARSNLAATLSTLGDLAGARALEKQVLEVWSRTLPTEHPYLQQARNNLAATIAREQARSAGSPRGEGERARAREGRRELCSELIGALCRAQVSAARAAILTSAARGAEERCASLAEQLDVSLSFARGIGVFEPLRDLESPAFVYAETTRGAAVASAELTRRAVHSPKYRELRESLGAASEEIADLAQKGTTSAEFDRARVKRESVERELLALARELSGGAGSVVEFDVESLAARLVEHEAAVAFRRFTDFRAIVVDEFDSTGQPAVRTVSTDNLCAFVVRSSTAHSKAALNGGAASDVEAHSSLTLVDVGPIAPIEVAARAWREAIGVSLERGVGVVGSETDQVRERGDELRQLVLDPLLAALGDAERLVVVLDDILHLVPLEALPLATTAQDGTSKDQLVGDRWTIETRATLTELLIDSPAPTGTALVALGGASFNVPSVALSADEIASVEFAASREPAARITQAALGEQSASDDVREPTQAAAILRGTAWERGFAPLTHTGDEARGIGALYTEIFEDVRPALVLEKRRASRDALVELAPKARFLHIATHGWFAPESIRSWSDPEPLDVQSGLGRRMSGEEQVKGMSPMLLCGLALAGANLPEDAVGRAPGLVTADELSTLDLSNCELAVLSACDTNVGERRAGQGVASLQKALQMAGARSVITSLWKVPDEATKELMLDFYRRLWVEQKSKHQALWEAKTRLREAKDERGEPLYTTRDWAAWVLTGEPE